MTKKELKKLAVSKIQNNKTRQETLTELKEETNEPLADIAKLLKDIPPRQTRKKYKVYNTTLLVILFITIGIKVLYALSFIMDSGLKAVPLLLIFPIFNIYFAYCVINFKAEIYKWIAIFTILPLFKETPYLFNGQMDIIKFTDLLIQGLLIFLGFFLKSKFSVDYETRREYFINESNEKRGRDVIYFVD